MIENKQLESIKVKIDDIVYSLNTDQNTASIIESNFDEEDLIIPKSINFRSKEYIITSILKNAFEKSYISSIHFPENSEIRTIEKKAFNSSTIKSLTIPSSLIDLKEGWCVNALWLTEIKVSPDNPLYKITKTNLSLENHQLKMTNLMF